MKYFPSVAAFLFAAILASVAMASGRGPSTREERQWYLDSVHAMQADPFATDRREKNGVLLAWLTEVPDVKLTICGNLMLGVDKNAYAYSGIIFMQEVFAAGAYAIEHPDGTAAEQNLAGVKAALLVYQLMLGQKPDARFSKLDELVVLRDQGELDASIANSGKCDAPGSEGANTKGEKG